MRAREGEGACPSLSRTLLCFHLPSHDVYTPRVLPGPSLLATQIMMYAQHYLPHRKPPPLLALPPPPVQPMAATRTLVPGARPPYGGKPGISVGINGRPLRGPGSRGGRGGYGRRGSRGGVAAATAAAAAAARQREAQAQILSSSQLVDATNAAVTAATAATAAAAAATATANTTANAATIAATIATLTTAGALPATALPANTLPATALPPATAMRFGPDHRLRQEVLDRKMADATATTTSLASDTVGGFVAGQPMAMQPPVQMGSGRVGLTRTMTAPALSQAAVPINSAAVSTSVPLTAVCGSNDPAALGEEGPEALPEAAVSSSEKVPPAYSASVDSTVKDERAADHEPRRKRGRGLDALG